MDTITFKPIYLEHNKGLGNAMREALTNCSNDLVARMDSDDISIHNRFELQLERLMKNPYIDIVGGNISEFICETNNIVAERVVPNFDKAIKQDMKRRCAMNHVTVMYKKEAVQDAGGYLDWSWNEDYYLWIRMLQKGCVFENIPSNLVNVRIGEDMSARRGGWKYFRSEQKLQKYMLEHKIINLPQYCYNVLLRFVGEVVATNSLRSRLFKFARKRYVSQENNVMERKSEMQKVKYPPFSVAMSVYAKDNAEWFDSALDSVINQTVKPDEIVLIVDGPVPGSIQKVIDKYTVICKSGGGVF